jgi:CRP/FNR family transcriptional regulator, cyclic AMP receptor protein
MNYTTNGMGSSPRGTWHEAQTPLGGPFRNFRDEALRGNVCPLESAMDKDLLRNIPLFARLSDDDRAELASLMAPRECAALEPVFWVGENGDAMYVVAHGKVRLSYTDEAGHDVTITVLGPGDFFGELSLLDGGPRTATARADTPAGLFSLNRKGFYTFLDRHPAAAVYMVSVLGARLRESLDRLRQVRNVNEEAEHVLTPFQRLIDRAAAIGTSGPFLVGNITFIVLWMAIHSILSYRAGRPIVFHDDPPTFFWLGLLIGMESILLTVFVLNSQRLSAKRDRIRADLEYQINLKAQTDVTNLTRKVDRIEAMLAQTPPNQTAASDGAAQQDSKDM